MLMRIRIEGRWTVNDYSILFGAIDRFYLFFSLVRIADFALSSSANMSDEIIDDDSLFDFEGLIDIHESLASGDGLFVKRISYASPGSIDLVGVGQLIGHLKDLLIKIIEIFTLHGERRARVKLMELDIEIRRLQLLREQQAFLKESGMSDVKISRAVAEVTQYALTLGPLVAAGKLKTVEFNSSDDN